MHFAGGTVLPLYKPISVRDWMRIPEDQAAVALWSSYLKRYKDYAKDLQSQIGWVAGKNWHFIILSQFWSNVFLIL